MLKVLQFYLKNIVTDSTINNKISCKIRCKENFRLLSMVLFDFEKKKNLQYISKKRFLLISCTL